MGEFVAHEPCPECGSKDNLARYADGSAHCFGCRHHERGSEEAPTAPERPAKALGNFLTGSYEDIPKRRLKADTLRKLGYMVGTYQGKKCHIAPIHNEQGELVAQKIRLPGKDFRVLGDLDQGGLVFQHRAADGGKRLVITEGEIDALSYAQAAPGWPVVSVPNGAQSAVKAVRRSIKFVDSFDEVVIMFDMDEAGEQAAKDVAMLLSPGKAKIASLPLKDANEMLVNNRVKELVTAVFQAKPYSPEGIVRGCDVDLASVKSGVQRGWTVPFPRLDQMTRGIRPGEVVLLAAGSGLGKSTIGRIMTHHVQQQYGLKVGFVMLEESVQVTARQLVAIHGGVRYVELAENPELLSDEDWQTAFDKAVQPAAFYDSFGSCSIDTIIANINHLAVAEGCQVVLLDHVSMVVSGSKSDNERREIDRLMTELRTLCERTGVSVIAISHVNRVTSSGGFSNEGGQISLNSLRGSGALAQLSDTVIGVERDQQDEEYKNLIHFRLLKSRVTGETGSAGWATYNSITGLLEPSDGPEREGDGHTQVDFGDNDDL
jgi:twinkle protein